MSSKYEAEGTTLDYANSTGAQLDVDVPVVIGDCVGVPVANIPNGETGVVAIIGRFRLMPKVAGTALAAGDRLDYDASGSAFTKGLTAASGDVEDCAICAEAAGSAATTVTVILNNPGTLN